MDWLKLAYERQEELLTELQQLIQINSVLDESSASAQHPFGQGPYEALAFMLNKGQEAHMEVKNIDNMAGHIEMGSGEDLLGVLCHVDVVPVGDGWIYPPFAGQIADGKLYGRGAIDDKGPTMAAWLAMKMVKDSGIKLNKRVRMIIGTDEESGFRCVTRYFEKEEMPSIGFAPDADFPLINAEKGIAHLAFTFKRSFEGNSSLKRFTAGKRTNMVPDIAQAIVTEDYTEKFEQFLQENHVVGHIEKNDDGYLLQVEGKAAHAMEPEKGHNAAVILAKFLATVLQGDALTFTKFMTDVFDGDHYGSALHLHYRDDMSGETTLNPGIISWDEHGGTIDVSMRYAVTYPFEEKITAAQQLTTEKGLSLDVVSNSKPHYVPEDDALVQTLVEVYQKYTQDFSPVLSTGGGTYARVLQKGVAFGMLFPGEKDVAHQKDEFIDIDHLTKAAAIYAEAIVRLASEN